MNSKIPFVLDFDLVEGYCKSGAVKPISRYVSNMVSQFADSAAAEEMVANGNPLLYEFYGLDLPEDDAGVLQFGTTILYPGKVGDEYFMTKGHFHTILDTAGGVKPAGGAGNPCGIPYSRAPLPFLLSPPVLLNLYARFNIP